MPAQTAPAAAPDASVSDVLSISQQIAAFAADLTPDAVPAAVRENAKLHVLDVVGTALAATRFDFAQHALAGISNIAEEGNNSVIGMNHQEPLRRFLQKVPGERFTPADGPATISGIAVEVDDGTGLALACAPLRIGGVLSETRPVFWS